MQNRIAIDGWSKIQPTKFEWNFSTTSTEDSGRVMSGQAMLTPLFTVEQFSVEYSNLKPADVSALLQKIVQRPSKVYFSLYYFSPYFGVWRTADFYVGNGSLKIRTLKESEENMQSVSFNIIGREPLC